MRVLLAGPKCSLWKLCGLVCGRWGGHLLRWEWGGREAVHGPSVRETPPAMVTLASKARPHPTAPPKSRARCPTCAGAAMAQALRLLVWHSGEAGSRVLAGAL